MENKRYHIVIASIVFAVLMWLSVNMRDDYTVVRHIPVVLENMKEGKALKYPVPKSISVRFRGSGWLLAGLYLSAGVKYFIDISSLSNGDFVVSGRDLLEHIKLPFALQPLDVKPDTIVLALEDYQEKRVPIIPRLVLDCREGFGQVGTISLVPESVLIAGSHQMLGPITAWPTAYRKLEDLRAPVDESIPLDDPLSYSIDVLSSTTRVRINVQPFAERIFLGIPILPTGVPATREVIFIPPKMDIVVRGGIDQLSKLSPSDFQASVNYQSLMPDSARSVVPILISPEDVKVVGKKPERFEYIIRTRL